MIWRWLLAVRCSTYGCVGELTPSSDAVTYLFRTTGQVLGVSLGGAILQSVLLQNLRARITGPGAAELIDRIRHSTAIIPDLEPSLREAAVDSYSGALRVVFICQAAWATLGCLFVIPIRENPLPGTQQEQEELYRQNALEDSGSQSDEEASSRPS